MPIKCPECAGKAIATSGSRALSELMSRKWYVCNECSARIPVYVKVEIDVEGVKRVEPDCFTLEIK